MSTKTPDKCPVGNEGQVQTLIRAIRNYLKGVNKFVTITLGSGSSLVNNVQQLTTNLLESLFNGPKGINLLNVLVDSVDSGLEGLGHGIKDALFTLLSN